MSEPALSDLRALAAQLARSRQDYDTVHEDLGVAKQGFEAENADLLATVAALKRGLDLVETQLRDETLRYFMLTGDKKPLPSAVEIAMTDEIVIADEAAAVAWCIAHQFTDLLTVKGKDVREFVKQTGRPVDGVTVQRLPHVRISTTLTAALNSLDDGETA